MLLTIINCSWNNWEESFPCGEVAVSCGCLFVFGTCYIPNKDWTHTIGWQGPQPSVGSVDQTPLGSIDSIVTTLS